MGNKLTISVAVLLVAGMGYLLQRQQKFQSGWQAERAAWEDKIARQERHLE